MINYQEIIEQLDDEKVKLLLNKLEIPFQDKGSFFILPTVCHNEDINNASWKLYYYKNTHIFQCYSNCGAMSIFTFLKNFYETRNIQYDWYTDIYQLITDCSSFTKANHNSDYYHPIRNEYDIKKDRKELPFYPSGVLEVFQKYYPIEWLSDGISKTVMDKYNIKYSQNQNKIIIPHYDINGNLVGIRGRALNQEDIDNFGKYMPVQIEGKWYSHPLSLNLYGLYQNKENIINTGICYLVEAEKSVLQMESFSIPNCAVAVCGNKLNKYALDLLIRTCHPKEIVIAFDKEEEQGSSEYFNHLYKLSKKYNRYCNFSFIYDKQNLLNMKDSPTDKGEEIFLKLLKERVKV